MFRLKRHGWWETLAGVVILITAAAMLLPRSAPLRSAGPLRQEAYLWQRDWNDPVRRAVRDVAPHFGGLVVLAAQVDWPDGRPRVMHVAIDYAALKRSAEPVGLALRIGAFDAGPATAPALAALAESLLQEAGSAGVHVRELQLDFDCAESKLEGYCAWACSIRQRIAPVPLTITVLPSWLSRSAFHRLIDATDGFVLQVHSFEKPRATAVRWSLCDPAAAQRAVELAGRMSRPFRVALPTYSYLAAFDPAGRFLRLSAEGPAPLWPANAVVRTVRADPGEMAGLVREWIRDRPANLLGIVWYRLPVDQDVLNWRWQTLSAVMAGRAPRPQLRAQVRCSEHGLYDVELINDGDADSPLRCNVWLTWSDGPLLAADGLGDFQRVDGQDGTITLTVDHSPQPLAPGEHRVIGWLRLGKDTEVHAHVSFHPS